MVTIEGRGLVLWSNCPPSNLLFVSWLVGWLYGWCRAAYWVQEAKDIIQF